MATAEYRRGHGTLHCEKVIGPAPNLREAGVSVEFSWHGRGNQKRRCLCLTSKAREPCAPNGPIDPNPGKQRVEGDSGGANGLPEGANDSWDSPAETPLFPDKIAAGAVVVVGGAKIPPCSNGQEWGEL